jgi:5-methylcytosine-specific restriction endonuclease McrA
MPNPDGWWRAMAEQGVTRTQWAAARAYIGASLPAPCTVCADDVQPWQRWHLDHRIPLALGGHPIALENLGPAHAGCNRRKGARILYAPRTDTAAPSRKW